MGPLSESNLLRSSEGACSLAREYFCDPSLFAEEYAKIFHSAWWMLGRGTDWSHSLDYQAVVLAGQPIVVVRQDSASLVAYHNVCRHRGAALLADGTGCLPHAALTCPYHAWTYHLDGALAGAPNMADLPDFKRQDWDLHPVTIQTVDGFVLANLSGMAHKLPDTLDSLLTQWQGWSLADLVRGAALDYTVRANWKLLFQNYSECYHCPSVHPALNRLTPYQNSSNVVSQGPVLGGPMILADGADSMSQSGRGVANALPGLSPGQRREVHYYTIFPSFFLSLHPDYVLVHRLNPIDVETTRVICDFLFYPSSVADPGFDPSPAVEFWDLTNRQDWEVCERVQLGARSRQFSPGIYSNLECTVAAFDRHYLQEMSAREGIERNGE